jgi:HK97 family phage prohead protease
MRTELVEFRRGVTLAPAPSGLVGVVVPYGEVSYRTEHRQGERFVPGAFGGAELAVAGGQHVPLLFGHAGPEAGYATRLQEARGGLVGAFRLHPTVEGRTAAVVATSGLVGLSVGFYAREVARGHRGERVVVAADLIHVALVPDPAYSSARVEPLVEARSAAALLPVRSHVPDHLAALWQ